MKTIWIFMKCRNTFHLSDSSNVSAIVIIAMVINMRSDGAKTLINNRKPTQVQVYPTNHKLPPLIKFTRTTSTYHAQQKGTLLTIKWVAGRVKVTKMKLIA